MNRGQKNFYIQRRVGGFHHQIRVAVGDQLLEHFLEVLRHLLERQLQCVIATVVQHFQ